MITKALGHSEVGLELSSLTASTGTDLNRCDGRLILTQLVQLLLHVAQDDGAWWWRDAQLLVPGPQHVLMLPLLSPNKTETHQGKRIKGRARIPVWGLGANIKQRKEMPEEKGFPCLNMVANMSSIKP